MTGTLAQRRPEVTPRTHVRVVAAGLAVLVGVVTVLTREVYDDPWILYRYAENLATGEGWVFNPGGDVENAVTSPLTVLLLAAGLAAGLPLAVAAGGLFALGTWTAAVCTWATLRRLGHETAGLAAAVGVVTAPPLLSLRGMETALSLGLLAACCLALASGRAVLLGVGLALAVLARPDAALFVLAVVAWQVATERRIPWRTIGAGAAVAAAWAAVSVPLTGGLLPSTLAAKVAQADSGRWTGYLRGLADLPGTLGAWAWFAPVLVLAVLGLPLAVGLRRSPLVPLALFAAGVVGAYGVVLGVAFYFWYAALPVYVLVLLAGLGVEQLSRLLPARAGGAVLAVGLAVLCGLGAVRTPVMDADREDYATVAEWLRTQTPADATVAAAEIGRIGHLADRRMVDYLGLLDGAANSRVADADWAWWVDELRPDYWVTFRPDLPGGAWSVEATVREDPRFTALYEPALQTDRLVVYRLR